MSFAILLKEGFNLAKEVFSALRDEEHNGINHSKSEHFLNSLNSISNEIRGTTEIIAERVIDKIEIDQLQKLNSRIKAVKLTIELEEKDSVTILASQLTESTDYALDRIKEGKTQWIGPWMIGEGTRIVLLKMISNTEKKKSIINKEVNNFRINILDIHKNFLLSNNSPWIEISEFIKGDNEKLLSILSSKIREIKNPINSKENSSIIHPTLEVEDKWDFPSFNKL